MAARASSDVLGCSSRPLQFMAHSSHVFELSLVIFSLKSPWSFVLSYGCPLFLSISAFRPMNLPREDGGCDIVSQYHRRLLSAVFIALVIFEKATMITTWVGLSRQGPDLPWIAYFKMATSV